MADPEELERLSEEMCGANDVEAMLDELDERGLDVQLKTIEYLPSADPEEIAHPRKAGFPMKRDWPAILKDAVARNVGSCELGRELGVAKSAVYQQCKRHGIALPNKAEEPLPPTLVAPYAEASGVEEWRAIPWTNLRYEASSEGRIRCVSTGGLVKQRIDARGYVSATIWINGKTRGQKVHRLIAWAFVSNPDGKPYVNHKDFDKSRNRPGNLEWMTWAENHLHGQEALRSHAVANPKMARKLSPENVVAIRVRGAAGESPNAIARDYGVSGSHVGNIIKGKKRTLG